MGVVHSMSRSPYLREKRPGAHCTEGWVGPLGSVWTGTENLAPTGIWSSDHPTGSKSLYRPKIIYTDWAIPAHTLWQYGGGALLNCSHCSKKMSIYETLKSDENISLIKKFLKKAETSTSFQKYIFLTKLLYLRVILFKVIEAIHRSKRIYEASTHSQKSFR
jgi:hypothetical protein